MNAMIFLKVAPLINDCPNCGNEFIGNGEGTLEVDDNFVRRTCKCGFKLEYDVNKGTNKKQLKQAITEALKQI